MNITGLADGPMFGKKGSSEPQWEQIRVLWEYYRRSESCQLESVARHKIDNHFFQRKTCLASVWLLVWERRWKGVRRIFGKYRQLNFRIAYLFCNSLFILSDYLYYLFLIHCCNVFVSSISWRQNSCVILFNTGLLLFRCHSQPNLTNTLLFLLVSYQKTFRCKITHFPEKQPKWLKKNQKRRPWCDPQKLDG